ncbi:unnamed protein product [Urochloa decumbens]|uniref:Uncharacterized protein n=1 Tax=Urochloa decumbens TaxID=240449 RepID=A0ABC9H188_9POAL
MSRRTWQPAAGGSRRSRRAEPPLPQPPTARSESPKIVSNPIFNCEAGPSQKPKPPANGDHLRCVYRPNSLYALVHDPADSAAANGKPLPLPLPLPPCRAHRAGQGATGSHVPVTRSGPAAVVAGAPHGSVMRRAATQDPFLAAYVACSKSGGGKDGAAGVDRPEQKQRKGKKKRRNAAAKKRGKEGEEIAVRGCGAIWSGGWAAAGAKYAGAMSCRHGCAVAEQKQGDVAHAAAAKKEAGEDAAAAAAAAPTLDLSWAPVVLSARALERRRQQR